MFYMPSFNVGEVVQLKFGGPRMTVIRVLGETEDPRIQQIDVELKSHYGAIDGDYVCEWSADGETKSGPFPMSILKSVTPVAHAKTS